MLVTSTEVGGRDSVSVSKDIYQKTGGVIARRQMATTEIGMRILVTAVSPTITRTPIPTVRTIRTLKVQTNQRIKPR
jgi:hypothetical protein